jgi:hypothetical protein
MSDERLGGGTQGAGDGGCVLLRVWFNVLTFSRGADGAHIEQTTDLRVEACVGDGVHSRMRHPTSSAACSSASVPRAPSGRRLPLLAARRCIWDGQVCAESDERGHSLRARHIERDCDEQRRPAQDILHVNSSVELVPKQANQWSSAKPCNQVESCSPRMVCTVGLGSEEELFDNA